MADYHSPTVVTPSIPVADMTALENLLLQQIFDESMDGNEAYFHAWCGPSDILTIDATELRTAWQESRESESRVNVYVGKRLEAFDATADDKRSDEIDLDLTGPDEDWTRMLQNILRRSQTLDEIVVTAAFTCSKMRSDAFGGSVMRITADAIQYASTAEMLEDTRVAPIIAEAMNGNETATCQRIEAIADVAGWDHFTLLLVIARWLEWSKQTECLIDFLDRLAGDEDH